MVYAYATTMRRAQGSTLDLVGLFFDRKKADRGYAYVGVSRVKRMLDAYHLGYIRRTDWLPVGGDSDGNEQQEPSIERQWRFPGISRQLCHQPNSMEQVEATGMGGSHLR